jgi:ribonucleoside-diphosphate reductase alpha chain
MGILRVDHPDIEEFIRAKQNSDKLNRFNLSIAITHEFMECLEAGVPFSLRFEGKAYREVDPRVLWETIMRSTWDWGEPGVIFIDTINNANNLQYCETIGATNPCSEQPLPPFGACLLGSINLVRFVEAISGPRAGGPRYKLDLRSLAQVLGPVVRALDNVVDVAMYPLPEQRQSAIANRRMGLGLMGVANALEACGAPYGTQEYIEMQSAVMTVLKNEAYNASAQLAKEKGVFPNYRPELYPDRPFIKSLWPSVQAAIREHGIRNSHLISIAPTGTISLCMDNVSSGIEPVFAVNGRRIVQMPGGPVEFSTVDYGYDRLSVIPRTAMEVTAQEHIDVLTAAQMHVDSSISKTCNVPSDMPWEAFKDLYMSAWKGGAKGCATFQDGGKRGSLLQAAPVQDCQGDSCAA